jgi:mRNA interferase MazF
VTFERYTVVRVPFPSTDREAMKNRPALILSDAVLFNDAAGHSVMTMITSARQSAWPLDCAINDMAAAGLPSPSALRFKLLTLDHRLVRGGLGRLSQEDEWNARSALARLFGSATQA